MPNRPFVDNGWCSKHNDRESKFACLCTALEQQVPMNPAALSAVHKNRTALFNMPKEKKRLLKNKKKKIKRVLAATD